MTSSETTIRTDAQRASSSRKLGRLSLVPTAAAAIAGWSASFIGLHGFAVKQMSGFTAHTAWLVPGAFDLSAFGSTVLVYRASINGRSGIRSRVLMYLFTALSAWINWIHQTGGSARFVACVLPVAAVLVFDGLAAEYRADWEADHGRKAFRMRLGLLLLRRMVDKEGTKAAFKDQITAIPVSALVGLGADLAAAAPVALVSEQSPEPKLEGSVPEPEPEPTGGLPVPVAPVIPVQPTAPVTRPEDFTPFTVERVPVSVSQVTRPDDSVVDDSPEGSVTAPVSQVTRPAPERVTVTRPNDSDDSLRVAPQFRADDTVSFVIPENQVMDDADALRVLAEAEPPAWPTMSKAAAVRQLDDILPGLTSPRAAELLGKLGVKTDDTYVRTERRRSEAKRKKEEAAAAERDGADGAGRVIQMNRRSAS